MGPPTCASAAYLPERLRRGGQHPSAAKRSTSV